MIIGFDAKRAAQNRTGLGNYSRFIIHSLLEHMQDHRLVLYVPDPHKSGLLGDLRYDPSIKIRYPSKGFWSRFRSLWRLWGQTQMVIDDDIEIYHGLSNELPLNIGHAKHTRTIVTIHDLIFRRYPAYYKPIDRWIYNYKFRKACKKADCIIAISECTKRDIAEYYHIPKEKIRIVYQGCDEVFRSTVSNAMKREVTSRYNLPEQYILYVGSIEERKNLMLLAKALDRIDKRMNVIALGKRTPYADKVEAYLKEQGLEERMRLISGVPFSHLAAFYQMASVFVYPSRFEGFGIPMLEALCSKVPAIGCSGSCLEEAGGKHSLYVDPDDDKALAEAVNRIINDENLRKEMIARGLEYAEQFTQEKLGYDLMKVYEDLIEKRLW